MKYFHIFWGKVIQGKKRGKVLGFPTANIRLHKKIPEGIYVSVISLSIDAIDWKLDREARNSKLENQTSNLKHQNQASSINRPASMPSVTFIGAAETFGEQDYKAETYILDFKKDIYDKWITVKLLRKIRENKRFASENALIEQIKQDILQTKDFFNTK